MIELDVMMFQHGIMIPTTGNIAQIKVAFFSSALFSNTHLRLGILQEPASAS